MLLPVLTSVTKTVSFLECCVVSLVNQITVSVLDLITLSTRSACLPEYDLDKPVSNMLI